MSQRIAPAGAKTVIVEKFGKSFFIYIFFYLLTPNDPIRVPVIEFGEPAAGYEEPVRQVNGRVSVGVHFDVFVHPSGQPLPYLIELQDPNP